MAEPNIYLYDTEDIDLRDSTKITLEPCKQFDDITLSFNIFDNGVALDLTLYTIDLRVLKSDNTFVIQDTNITKTTNNIKIECIRDITRVSGKIKCELRLVNSLSKQKTSFDFVIPIKPSVISDNTVGSGNIVTATEELNASIVIGNTLDGVLKEDILTGIELDTDLDENISTGTTLNTNLNTTINTANTSKTNLETTTNNANTKKTELEGVIVTANTSKTNLEGVTVLANTKKTELDTSVANAQDEINAINAKGNDSYTILSTDWVGTEPNLTYPLNHGLNSKNPIVGVINEDTKLSSFSNFKYIDMNNIELQSTTKSNVTVSINANYYSGKDANIVAQEVIDARGNKSNLKTRLDGVDEQLAEKANENYVDTKFGNMGNTKIFKGSCLFAELPTSGMNTDDYWYVSDKTTNYCYNGTSWVDIGNNLKIGNSAVAPINTSFIDVAYTKGKNRYNPNDTDIKLGQYLRGTGGTLINAPTLATTGYIPIDNGDSIYYSYINAQLIFGSFTNVRTYEIYDANKVFLAGSGSTTTLPITINNANAKFIRMSINDYALYTKLQVSKEVMTVFEDYYADIPNYTLGSDIKLPIESFNNPITEDKLSVPVKAKLNKKDYIKSPLYTEEFVSFAWTQKTVTGIDLNGYFNVSGVTGDTELTIIAGGTVDVSGITNTYWAGALLYDDLKCVPCCVTAQDVANGKLTVYPPLTANITNGKIGSLKADNMHLTELGYKALMQHVYSANPKYCEKNKWLARYLPRLDTAQTNPPNNPFTKYGALGSFKNNGASVAYNETHFVNHIHFNDLYLSSSADSLLEAGCSWEKDLSSLFHDGYLETFIGNISNSSYPETLAFKKTDGYEMYIEWYLDDVLVKQIIKTDNKCDRICFDFYKENSKAKIKIYYKKVRLSIDSIIISDSTFWINEVNHDTKLIPRFATVAQMFDSWGENPIINSTPTYASALEMKRLINADAGVTVPYENHSKGGQTSAWGKSWFYENVQKYHPSHMITDFGINDGNSIPSNLPATVLGFDGLSYNNRLTFAQYKQNLNDIFNMALVNNIQPIFIGGSFGWQDTWRVQFFDDKVQFNAQ